MQVRCSLDFLTFMCRWRLRHGQEPVNSTAPTVEAQIYMVRKCIHFLEHEEGTLLTDGN
jgi:hypothetical protein